MVTVYLCDTEKKFREELARCVSEITRRQGIPVSISAFGCSDELIFQLADIPHAPDIIVMDVQLGRDNGIEVARKLKDMGCTAEILFFTADKEQVFSAFEVSPVHYLIKGETSAEKFERAFLRAVSLAEDRQSELFICETGNARRVVPIREISYFEIWKRIIVVHQKNGETIEFYGTMEQLENQLEDRNFIRTHRSYLVNLKYISKFHPQSLLLKTGESIPIGITHAKEVKEHFSNYVSQARICNF